MSDAAEDAHMVDPRPYPGMPRWVKAFVVAGAVLAMLAVIALLTGHGPGRHLPP